jgi:hypothetical protein
VREQNTDTLFRRHTFFNRWIVNESQMWNTQKIPLYNRQTYILLGLQSDTWYELRMFAENKLDKSNTTDIQSISTVPPSVEKGMSSK